MNCAKQSTRYDVIRQTPRVEVTDIECPGENGQSYNESSGYSLAECQDGDFVSSLLQKANKYQVNKGYDASPIFQQPHQPFPATPSNHAQAQPLYQTGSHLNLPGKSLLSAQSTSSSRLNLSSSHQNLAEACDLEDNDRITSILSYGVYGALLLLLAVVTTVFLAVFGS